MIDNEARADYGQSAILEIAQDTGTFDAETIDTAISDGLAYVAHFCVRVGIDPEAMFARGLRSFEGDREDGPLPEAQVDGEATSFAEWLR